MTDTDRMVVWLLEALDAAQHDAEAATPGPWHVTAYNWQTDFDAGIGTSPGDVDVVGHGYEGGGVERVEDARHIVRHDPAAVLRRIATDRKLLDDLLAEKHYVLEDSWYRCSAADRAGDRNGNEKCDCGRDERVQRRLRLLAEGYDWKEEQQ